MSQPKIIFTFPIYASFVRNDEAMMKKHFSVHSFNFNQKKTMLPFSFLKQFLFLLFNGWKTDCFVSFFAGYSSFLPALFAKIMGKPHLIILGGTDCSSFPSIGYGNFQKRFLGWFTCQSLKMATHLSPVAETLIETDYTYLDTNISKQGYRFFCPAAKAPATTIHIGYDSEKFFRTKEKIPNSFLTLSQMNAANFYRKGIDLIFIAAEKFPDCTFTLVGNTPEMKYDFVPANVKLLPFVKYELLKDFYSEYEFYFQLSIMEGFPSAPCEAMLCECIPITSNVGALPAIVGDAGFILTRKDSSQLESLIQQALKTNRKEAGLKAREQIIKNFPKDERVKLISLITSMLQS